MVIPIHGRSAYGRDIHAKADRDAGRERDQFLLKQQLRHDFQNLCGDQLSQIPSELYSLLDQVDKHHYRARLTGFTMPYKYIGV